MSLIARIFSTNQKVSVQPAPVSTGRPLVSEVIDIDILKTLIPIRSIGDEELNAFAADNKSEVFPAGSVLFESGEQDDSVLYLLEGTVRMETDCGTSYLVDAHSAKARFPLSSGRQHGATAYAQGDVSVLRVSNRVMALNEGPRQTDSLLKTLQQADIPDEVHNLRLFESYCQHLAHDKIKIPMLPDVAVKLRKAIAQDLPIDRLVDIVQLDASIASKLIQVANCPLFLAKGRVSNCRDAIIRLGLNATRNLVISLSIKHLINCKHKEIRQRLKDLWQQSAHLSCLSFVLAAETKQVNPEEALLAGLIADIGLIPFLQFVDNFPKELYEPEDVDKISPYVKGPSGRYLLAKWDFPNELAAIPDVSENWYHDQGERLQLADIVILSRLHRYIGTPKMAELPAINSVPACGKLEDGTLSPEHSLNVLHQAKDKIRETLTILGS
ncbi:MAG: HDOD domain-containing protein [Methylococcaceae bacterium]|nr:HDOD domain-containing protein [Methylococcaceae bacterium]